VKISSESASSLVKRALCLMGRTQGPGFDDIRDGRDYRRKCIILHRIIHFYLGRTDLTDKFVGTPEYYIR
jgi:hypothetical protein